MLHRNIFLLATALSGWMSVPALAQEAKDNATGAAPTATDIIVTARRTSERLQDVPVAVSVISSETIETKGAFNPVDLVQSTPGLSVTATISQRNNLTYTIRGQGYAYGTVFPAVITYFNEVPIARLTEGTFFDIANIQVLRGPQGVNFGRVTDGGNVMVTPQAPKDEFGGYVGARVGNYGLRAVNGAINIPIVEDAVLFRAAFETTRRDGFTKNLFNGQSRDNVAYEGYRGALTLRPTSTLENTTFVSYLNTHDRGTGTIYAGINDSALGAQIGQFGDFLFAGGYGIDSNGSVRANAPGLTPFTAANYLASQHAQLAAQQARGPRAVSLVDASFTKRKNLYIVNTTTADISDSIQIKNVFGYVKEKEFSAANYGSANGAAVLTCISSCANSPGLPFVNGEQISEELRIAGKAFDNRLTWSLGGYMDEQRPAGQAQNATINLAILNRYIVSNATTKSRAIYGSAEFAVTDNFKINGGLRYTKDSIHSEQNVYLSAIPGGEAALFDTLTGPKALFLGFPAPLDPAVANYVVAATFAPIPHGQCVTYAPGSLFYNLSPLGSPCVVVNEDFKATTWQLGASYNTNNGQLFYAKISKGYRPGGVNSNLGLSYKPETDVSIEAGVKADFDFDGVFLRTNIAGYSDRYKAIQKTVVLPGPTSVIQNVTAARIKGIETEVTLIPVQGLTLGSTFAYTDAKFDKATPNPAANPCDPLATSNDGFCSDNRFNAVPKTQYTFSLTYTLPLPEDVGNLSIGGRVYHQSSIALNDTSKLNPNVIEPGYTTVDLNVSWKDVFGKPVDLGFFVTNLTNKLYRIGSDDITQQSSVGIRSDIFAAPRMWGFNLKYRFGSDAD